jgi:hypothetical protein
MWNTPTPEATLFPADVCASAVRVRIGEMRADFEEWMESAIQVGLSLSPNPCAFGKPRWNASLPG